MVSWPDFGGDFPLFSRCWFPTFRRDVMAVMVDHFQLFFLVSGDVKTNQLLSEFIPGPVFLLVGNGYAKKPEQMSTCGTQITCIPPDWSKDHFHGNLRYPPKLPTPINKALLRDLIRPAIRALFLGGVALGGYLRFPWHLPTKVGNSPAACRLPTVTAAKLKGDKTAGGSRRARWVFPKIGGFPPKMDGL